MVPATQKLKDSIESLVTGIEVDLDEQIEQEPFSAEKLPRDRLDD